MSVGGDWNCVNATKPAEMKYSYVEVQSNELEN